MGIRIAGMMRVKNEERWIREAVESLSPLCSTLSVLDDQSTDHTTEEIYKTTIDGLSIIRSPFSGLDEQRDKNFLLGSLLIDWKDEYGPSSLPDWIIHIDGDEVLDEGAVETIRHYAETCDPAVQAFVLKVDYLWDSPNQYRVDGRYDRFWRGSMFRVKGLTRGFKSTAWGDGSNLHCLNIPAGITNAIQVPVRLKHYGYMDRDDRLKKYEYYNRVDPENEVEDRYRHMVLGDLEGLPGETVTKWAGPLTLREWEPGMKVEIPV